MPVQRCPRCGWKLTDKSFTDAVKKSYPRAYAPWTPEEDVKLKKLVEEKTDLIEMTVALGRQASAVTRRIELLKLRGCEPAVNFAEEDALRYLKGQK